MLVFIPSYRYPVCPESRACFHLFGVTGKIHVGASGLSAYSAIGSFGCVYWAVPAGVTSAVLVLGSVYVGEEDIKGLKVLLKTLLKFGLGLVIIVSVLLAVCCLPLTHLFFKDPLSPEFQMALLGFALFPLSSPISAFNIGYLNYYHSQAHERMARVISVTDGIIGVSLFIFLLVPFLGMTGVWLAQLFGNLFCTLVVFTCAWVYNKKPPFSFDRMMCLPKGFGVPDENRIDISIHSIDEVINISERVWDFCLNHGVSRRSTYCASLCVEEMAGNIVLHGFDGRQDRNLDARVSLIRDEVVISLKDDCKAFNPTEAAKIFDPDDITHNIGLRLAAAISGEMSYQNTFGLNVLTIRIG